MAYASTIHPAIAAAMIASAALAWPVAASASGEVKEVVIVSGAIKDPSNALYAQAPVDKNVPELPVVYEPKQDKKS